MIAFENSRHIIVPGKKYFFILDEFLSKEKRVLFNIKIVFKATALLLVGLFLFSLATGSYAENGGPIVKNSLCDGKKWSNPKERLDCLFPAPPIGRWKAAYTKEFAEKYKLPMEGVSTDLSQNIAYIEMDVQPYGVNGTACLVNLLINKPNDFSFYGDGENLIQLPDERKLIHFLDLDHHKDKLRPLISFNSVSRDYDGNKGFRDSTFGMYLEDILPDYDYVTADADCRLISMSPQYFPGGYALWVNKASVWGKYQKLYKSANAPGRPKGQDYYNAHLFINIPREIVSAVFEDVAIGGQ